MGSAAVVELRKYNRVSPDHLYAMIGEEFVRVDNISPAGICIGRPVSGFSTKDIRLWIVPVVSDLLDMHKAVAIQGHIVGQSDDQIRIVFSAVNHQLANMIHRYQASRQN